MTTTVEEAGTIARDEDRPRLWPEPWARQARVKADIIERQTDLAVAAAGTLTPRAQAAVDAIRDLLGAARQATGPRGRLRWRGPFDRWRGTSVEQAYLNLHAAQTFQVEVLPPEDLDALVPTVLAKLSDVLPPADVRRLRLERLMSPRSAAPDDAEALERKRAELRQATEIAYDASDQVHARVRGFRNTLLAAAGLIAVFMIAMVVIVSRSPASMPLCFQPTTASGVRTVCPSGEDPQPLPSGQSPRQPAPADIMIVAGLGLLGGALAAAWSIRKIRGTTVPYDVPIALALLKVPCGALTAVAGILLLGGGFVPGLSELDSQRQILAYALVLGYAQQLATRFIDQRAQSLLNSVPSKDAEAHVESGAAGA
jgi:hypothetical protein